MKGSSRASESIFFALLAILSWVVAVGAGITLTLVIANEVSAPPMPEESEATETGRILTLASFLPLLIILSIAIIGIVAVWILRRKHLIF